MNGNNLARATRAAVLACITRAAPALAQEVPASDPTPAASPDEDAREAAPEPAKAGANNANSPGAPVAPAESDDDLPWNRDTTPADRPNGEMD